MTCPKLAKAWMRGDGPAFVTLGRWLWRGRTPMNVRQIEVRNDSAMAELAQVPRHFRLAQKLRTPDQPASGNAHEN
jgi:hypothetical protein